MNLFLPKFQWRSRMGVFAYRICLILFILLLCRLIYVFSNWQYFAPITVSDWKGFFLGGLLFDGASIAYGLSPFIFLTFFGALLPECWEYSKLYRILLNLSYFIPNIINIGVNMTDAAYYPFTKNRMSFSVFTEFSNENLFLLMGRLMLLFWGFTLLFLLLVGLLILLYSRVGYRRRQLKLFPWRAKIGAVALIFIMSRLCVYTIRGGFDLNNRPISPMEAMAFVDNVEHRPVVINTFHNLIRSTRKTSSLEALHYYPEEQLERLFNPYYSAKPLSETDSLYGSMRGRNVVFIALESFAAEFSGFYNKNIPDYPSYMPFLDSLAAESYTFEYGFANGNLSIQAMPSALTSLPSLGMMFVASVYASDKLLGLPEVLGEQGYSSCFYHGGLRNSLGFTSFTKSIGMQSAYDKEDYPDQNDFDGLWGIFDEPFLQATAGEIAKMERPYLATIFTLSSHTPYTLPEQYKDVFLGGDLPNHKVTQYADNALRRFFDRMRELPDYENTLFVLMADHTTSSSRPEYRNLPARWRIPIIFFDPKGELKGLNTSYAAQQADIFPTLLYLLGDDRRIVSFGHNLFDPNVPHYALERVDTEVIQLRTDGTLIYDIAKEEYRMEPPVAGISAPASVVEGWQPPADIAQRVDTLKAIIQQFNN